MSEPRALVAASQLEHAMPVRAVLAVSLVACLAGLAVVLAARRASGALLEPLPMFALVTLVLVVAAIAALARRLTGEHTAEIGAHRWLTVALSVVSFLIAAAVSLPGTSPLGLAALWTIVVGSEAWAWRSMMGPACRQRERLTPIAVYSPEVDDSVDVVELDDDVADEDLEEESIEEGEEAELPPENVVQQLTRERLEVGGEMLSGSLRVSFAPRERTTVAHIAFCPPFETMPSFSAEPWDGPGASVKVLQTLLHGARIEVKLDRESSLESSVLIAFEAIATSDS